MRVCPSTSTNNTKATRPLTPIPTPTVNLLLHVQRGVVQGLHHGWVRRVDVQQRRRLLQCQTLHELASRVVGVKGASWADLLEPRPLLRRDEDGGDAGRVFRLFKCSEGKREVVVYKYICTMAYIDRLI